MNETDLLISFTTESLFAIIPIHEFLEIIRRLLTVDDISADIANLAKICLFSICFQFWGFYYKQKLGATVFLLFPVVANFYMEEFKKNAMKSTFLKPKWWLRYVNDNII